MAFGPVLQPSRFRYYYSRIGTRFSCRSMGLAHEAADCREILGFCHDFSLPPRTHSFDTRFQA